MSAFLETFEQSGGTNFTASNTSYDSVSPTTATADTVIKHVGTSSLKSAGTGELYLTHIFPSDTPAHYRRFYIYPRSTPSANAPLCYARTSGDALCYEIRLTTSRTIQIRNSSYALQATTTTALPLDEWSRVEIAHNNGTATVRVYTGGDLDAAAGSFTEEISGTYATTAVAKVTTGWTSAASTFNYNLDDAAGSDSDWVGPAAMSAGTLITKHYIRRNGQWKPVTRRTTGVPVIPQAPTNLQAIAGDGNVALSWSKPPSAVNSYNLYRNGSVIATPGGTLYTDSGLTNNTVYSYRVSAVSAAGEGALSASVSATPTSGTVPGAPTGVTATPGDAQATVNWTAPASDGGSALTGNVVSGYPTLSIDDNDTAVSVTLNKWTYSAGWVATSGGSHWTDVAGVTATIEVSTVNGGSVVLYGVLDTHHAIANVSVDGGAQSIIDSYSATRQVDVVMWVSPALSAGTHTIVITTTNTGNPNRTGSDADFVIRGVDVVGDSGSGAPITSAVSAGATNTAVTGLTNGTKYAFSVVAQNANGDGNPSVVSNAVTPVPASGVAPGAPTNLQVTAGDTQVSLSWTAPAGSVTDYRVYRDSSLVASPAGTSYTNTGLTNGISYSFTVSAVNAAGEGPTSGAKSATPFAPASSQERFPGDPNPIATGKTYWGEAHGGNGDPSTHESASGTVTSIRRTFFSNTSQATAPNGGLFTMVRGDHTAGRLPWVSFKVSFASMTSANDTRFDALFDQLIAELESYSKPTWVSINHEPENDGGGEADAPAWRYTHQRFRARMDAYNAANPGQPRRISFGGILMYWTFVPSSGRDLESWYPGAGVWDWCGNDFYTEANQQLDRSSSWVPYRDWCVSKGLPMCFPEWGLRKEDVNGPTKMQNFWNSMFTLNYDFVAFAYFDTNLNSTGSGWTLTNDNGLLNKYNEIMQDTKVMHLSDLGY